MRITFSQALLLSWAAVSTTAADVDLEQVCTDVRGVSNGCAGTYDHPVRADRVCTLYSPPCNAEIAKVCC